MGKRIKFKGIVNFRELGDFNTMNGPLTQNGRIYRSSMLFADEAADVEKMKDLGIQTIFDLRSPKEIERHPNQFKKLVPHYLTINLSGGADAGRSLEMSKTTNDPYFMKLRYMEYLEEAKDEITKLFRQLIQPDSLPAVVHCSAGKDRTGVISYLLLKMAGVPIEEIVADYQVSYGYIKNDVRIIKEGHQQNIYHSYPEIMEGLDQLFTAQYADVADYFVSLGLNADEIELVRGLLL